MLKNLEVLAMLLSRAFEEKRIFDLLLLIDCPDQDLFYRMVSREVVFNHQEKNICEK